MRWSQASIVRELCRRAWITSLIPPSCRHQRREPGQDRRSDFIARRSAEQHGDSEQRERRVQRLRPVGAERIRQTSSGSVGLSLSRFLARSRGPSDWHRRCQVCPSDSERFIVLVCVRAGR